MRKRKTEGERAHARMKIKGKDGRQDVGGSAHCTGIRKGKS
jgi:hypothetical protein